MLWLVCDRWEAQTPDREWGGATSDGGGHCPTPACNTCVAHGGLASVALRSRQGRGPAGDPRPCVVGAPHNDGAAVVASNCSGVIVVWHCCGPDHHRASIVWPTEQAVGSPAPPSSSGEGGAAPNGILLQATLGRPRAGHRAPPCRGGRHIVAASWWHPAWQGLRLNTQRHARENHGSQPHAGSGHDVCSATFIVATATSTQGLPQFGLAGLWQERIRAGNLVCHLWHASQRCPVLEPNPRPVAPWWLHRPAGGSCVGLLASQMVQCSEVWQQESLVPSRATLCPS